MMVGFVGDGNVSPKLINSILEDIFHLGFPVSGVCMNLGTRVGQVVLSVSVKKNLNKIVYSNFARWIKRDQNLEFRTNKKVIQNSRIVVSFENLNASEATIKTLKYLSRARKHRFRYKEDIDGNFLWY